VDILDLKVKLFNLLQVQNNLRSMAKSQCCLFVVKHDLLAVEIDRLDKQIREAIFIEYCNTPCWRYKC